MHKTIIGAATGFVLATLTHSMNEAAAGEDPKSNQCNTILGNYEEVLGTVTSSTPAGERADLHAKTLSEIARSLSQAFGNYVPPKAVSIIVNVCAIEEGMNEVKGNMKLPFSATVWGIDMG